MSASAERFAEFFATPDWVLKHEAALREALPADWVAPSLDILVRMGFHLKLLGVDWRKEEELVNIMIFFARIGLVEHNAEKLVRVNPKPLAESLKERFPPKKPA